MELITASETIVEQRGSVNGALARCLVLKIPFQVCYFSKNCFVVCMCDTWVEGHTCVCRGRRTPYRVCFCLPAFCLLCGSYPGCQVLWQMPLPFEPSCWSLRSSIFLKRMVQACYSKHYLTDESKRMFVSNQRWMSATSVCVGGGVFLSWVISHCVL